MDMKEEMMNDALDDALGDEDDEEERCAVIVSLACFINYCSLSTSDNF